MSHATVRLAFFNLDYHRDNFSILVDIDTDESYCVKSNWIPPVVDDDLCYSLSEEFDIDFEIVGQREDKRGRRSTEISII